MRYTAKYHSITSILSLIFALQSSFAGAQTQRPKITTWQAREDLNILLPASIRLYETNGLLHDSAHVRAMYATIDLRDQNLKVRAVGSNTVRETTQDSYKRHRAILAINGGYFSAKKSESILISEGKVVATGPTR